MMRKRKRLTLLYYYLLHLLFSYIPHILSLLPTLIHSPYSPYYQPSISLIIYQPSYYLLSLLPTFYISYYPTPMLIYEYAYIPYIYSYSSLPYLYTTLIIKDNNYLQLIIGQIIPVCIIWHLYSE